MDKFDAAEFFWLRKPKLLTSLFTLAYFQNSLSISIIIFTFAGSYDAIGTWEGVPAWAAILQLCLDLLLWPQVRARVPRE